MIAPPCLLRARDSGFFGVNPFTNDHDRIRIVHRAVIFFVFFAECSFSFHHPDEGLLARDDYAVSLRLLEIGASEVVTRPVRQSFISGLEIRARRFHASQVQCQSDLWDISQHQSAETHQGFGSTVF